MTIDEEEDLEAFLWKLEASDSLKKHWRITGESYGYPQCCIEYFVNPTSPKTLEQSKAGNNTGFIPCPNCTSRILSGEISLNQLLNRNI
jgi:hypothetical protein